MSGGEACLSESAKLMDWLLSFREGQIIRQMHIQELQVTDLLHGGTIHCQWHVKTVFEHGLNMV